MQNPQEQFCNLRTKRVMLQQQRDNLVSGRKTTPTSQSCTVETVVINLQFESIYVSRVGVVRNKNFKINIETNDAVVRRSW